MPGTDTAPHASTGDRTRPGEGNDPPGTHPGGGRWRGIAVATVIAAFIAAFITQHARGASDHTSGQPSAATVSDGSSPTAPPAAVSNPDPSTNRMTDPGRAIFSWETDGADDSHENVPVPSGGTWADRGPSTSPEGIDTRMAPTITVVPAARGSLPADENVRIVGLSWPSHTGSIPPEVVSYRPSTGEMVTTPVPATGSSGPFSFVSTAAGTIFRPLNTVTGYLVRHRTADQPELPQHASELAGELAHGGVVLPGPDARHVWVSERESDAQGMTLTESDLAGNPGATITVSGAVAQSGPYWLIPDGSGYVLARGIGGTYLLRPDGARLVTHGIVLAAGPTAFLLYECGEAAQCQTVLLDRGSGKKHALAGVHVSSADTPLGVISPDGRYAGLLQRGPTGMEYALLALRSGTVTRLGLTVPGTVTVGNNPAQFLAFTPDSRFLLMATERGVVPVDTSDSSVLAPLPMPPVSAISLRPAG